VAKSIGMREDTRVNILPNPKGLVLEMEHERSGWTNWLELTVRRGLVELAGCVAAGRLLGVLGPFDEACSSVKLDEAGERIWLIPT
jgi:hypothetical protein